MMETAQSVVSEAKHRERSGQPVVIPQRRARPQQFLIGNDETELELSVESRSFSNRVNDQVRKRQKRSFMNVTEDGENIHDMENVHVCNSGISSVHGKELLEQLSFHREYKRLHTETNVRHIYKIGVRTIRDLWSENNYRHFDRIDGEPMEFEWNIFPRFSTLQLSEEVKRFAVEIG